MRAFGSCLLLCAALAGRGSGATSSSRTPPDALRTGDDLRWVRGVNWVPSRAHNDVATWQDWNATAASAELGWAAAAGFNAVRVFLASLPWLADAPRFRASLASFLAIATAHGLTAQLVVFDSCFGDINANVSWIASGLYKNSSWIPNPGPAIVADPTQWALYEAYVADVVSVVSASPAVFLWDVMNEPQLPASLPFIAHMSALLGRLDARPRTVGVASSGSNTPALTAHVTALSFHNYNGGGEGAALSADIAAQRELAAALNMPLILTESMSRPSDLLTSVLPAVYGCTGPSNASVGFFVWELMLGVDQFNADWPAPYQGMVYPEWAPAPASGGAWRYPAERDLLASYFAAGSCPLPPHWLPDTAAAWSYAPADAWTAWSGAGPANGTLHYANEAGAVASAEVPVGAGASALSLVYKRGPDCGVLAVALDGQLVAPAVDAYALDVDWAAVLRVPIAAAGPRTHVLDVTVTGEKNPAATDNYAQVVGVAWA